jgi:hypothetical protein
MSAPMVGQISAEEDKPPKGGTEIVDEVVIDLENQNLLLQPDARKNFP